MPKFEKQPERLPIEGAQKEAVAIEGMAGEKAETELLHKPEARHYEHGSQNIDVLKGFNPKLAERAIEMWLGARELEEEMGPESSGVVKEAARDVMEKTMEKVRAAMKSISSTEKDMDKLKEELLRIIEWAVNDFEERFRADERIKEPFSGKDELLDKVVDFNKKSTMQLMESLFAGFGL